MCAFAASTQGFNKFENAHDMNRRRRSTQIAMKNDLKSRGVSFDAYTAKGMMGNGIKGQSLQFNAGLSEFCQTGDCSDWDTKGKYYTRTGPTGQNVLVMKIDVIAPVNLTGTYNEAVFDVATTKEGNG